MREDAKSDETDFAEVARDVAREAGLPDGGELRRLAGGVANHVFGFGGGRGRWVIRIGSGADGRCFPKSVGLLQLVEGKMWAPRPVFEDCGGRRWPWNVMVCEYLAGESLKSRWGVLSEGEVMGILERLVGELRVVHGVEGGEWGRVHGLAEPLTRVVGELGRLFAAAEGVVPGDMVRVMRGYVEGHWERVADLPRTVVMHNDVQWSNVLVDGGRYAGLIDFDDAELGWVEMDALAMVHMVAAAGQPGATSPLMDGEVMGRACRMVRRVWPGVFDEPGCLERHMVEQILAILGDLVEPPAWESREESREHARAVWRAVFERRDSGKWFEGH